MSKASTSRRQMLVSVAALGGGTAAWSLISGCAGEQAPGGGTDAHPGGGHAKAAVAPGDHDEYYGFWSGGQSGEVRVLGIPSTRPGVTGAAAGRVLGKLSPGRAP